MSDPHETLTTQVHRTLNALHLNESLGMFVVAVSGGADSVCLLSVLRELNFRLAVAHFDHQTRDGASREDATFVRKLAAELELPFYFDTAPIETLADASARSFEEFARDARYAFLLKTARQHDCTVVVTGHHGDDVAETVMMRVLRGTSPSGLAGIPPITKREGVSFIRPLIHASKTSIEDYLHAGEIPYREDASNKDTRFLRNRVRHELLPQLRRDYNPTVDDALRRLANIHRGEEDLLDGLARAAFDSCAPLAETLERNAFRALHPALQRRVLLIFAWQLGVRCEGKHVAAAVRFITEGDTGRVFDLGGGVQLTNTRTTTTTRQSEMPSSAQTTFTLRVPETVSAFGRRIETRHLDAHPLEPLKTYCSPTRQVFDAEKLVGELTLRSRRKGDRFRPLGMTGTRKLKDYFGDVGVPVAQRDAQPLLVVNDEIIWVLGHAVGASAAVRESTEHLVEVVVHDEAR